MAKRTTQSTGTVKRTRKTAPRKTTRRTAAKPVEAAAPVKAATARAVEAAGAIEAATPEPTDAQIAERAYFLSLERHGPGGPLDDWLQAERELRNGSE
ncbi:MAG: DUF2934 domain-containing protein [Acidobacteriota bacterium]|nr:DUF2934 domain-containing protein [Acidobacteriota bacterium]